MTSLTDPIGGTPHTFTYDAYGQLIQDTNPTGASILLNRSSPTTAVTDAGVLQPFNSWTTAITNGAGDMATHQVQMLANNTSVYTDTTPSGATHTNTQNSSGVQTVVAPDGTKTVTTMGPDPQYGTADPMMTSITTTTPAGVQSQTTHSRIFTAGSPAALNITDTVTRGPATGNGQLVTTSYYQANTPASAGGTTQRTTTLTGSGLSRSVQLTLDGFGRTTQLQPLSCTGGTCVPATAPGSSPSVAMAATNLTYGGALGKLSQMSIGSRNWNYTYSPTTGYLESLAAPSGTTSYAEDSDGRVTTTTLPDMSTTVTQSYDLNGNIHTITVPKATALPSTHTFNYTPLNLLQSYDPPQTASADGGTPLVTLNTTYTYDNDKNVLTVQAPEGSGYDTVQKLYDPYGRLSSRYDPLSGVTATYGYVTSPHITDQIATVTTTDGVTVANTYDGFLKASTKWTSSSLFSSGVMVTWAHDSFFRPSELTVTGGSPVVFSYNDPDGLYTGTLSGTTFAVTRDAATGLPTTAVLGILKETWTYDAYGAPATFTVTNTSTGATIYSMNGGTATTPVGRDPDGSGRLQSMTETNDGRGPTAWSFAYNALGQLDSVTDAGTTRTYGYDPNGNLTTQNGTTVGTYDAQDRLVKLLLGYGASVVASYTNNGDLTSLTSNAYDYSDFTYDLSSNLRTASETTGGSVTGSVQYSIDGLNRRVGKKWAAGSASVEEGLLYDEQGRVVAELAGTGSSLSLNSTFVYGLKPNVPDYMIQGSTTYLIVSDWRGSVRDVVNASTGAIVQSFDYDEWGTITTSVGDSCMNAGYPCLSLQPFRFAGGIYDPVTGFTRFGARDYDPQLRRWTEKDPIRFRGRQTNLYVYAGDDPINRIDPKGSDATMACNSLPDPCDTPPSPAPPTQAGQSYGVNGQTCVQLCQAYFDQQSARCENCTTGNMANGATQSSVNGDALSCVATVTGATVDCITGCGAPVVTWNGG